MAAPVQKKNWFAIWVTIGVVVALVVVGGIVLFMNNAATAPAEPPVAADIDSETGAIVVGDGPNTLDTYVDFMCPACNQFESVYGSTVSGLVDDGSLTLNLHPVAILDRLSQGTQYSTRSANAMYCVAVADGSKVPDFLAAMYANQPAENTTGLTDEQILAIAATVGVTGIDDCVTEGSYADFVTSQTGQLPPNPATGQVGTPTVILNGDFVQLTGDPQADITANLK